MRKTYKVAENALMDLIHFPNTIFPFTFCEPEALELPSCFFFTAVLASQHCCHLSSSKPSKARQRPLPSPLTQSIPFHLSNPPYPSTPAATATAPAPPNTPTGTPMTGLSKTASRPCNRSISKKCSPIRMKLMSLLRWGYRRLGSRWIRRGHRESILSVS